MNNTSFFTQTHVYFKKVFRISMREKAWKYLIFAAIISSIVALIVGPEMFENFDRTNSGFFTLGSACIWIGIFNSIQSVCKEHEIIRAEYRQGMKISSYIAAQVLWQALLCLAQTVIIFGVCCLFMHFERSEHLLLSPFLENFVTIYLLTFGAAVLGLMISSVSGTPTTAMTIMPFVLIVQLVLSGVLFELDGVAEGFSYVTLSKWGMAAFGCEAGLNDFRPAVEDVLHEAHLLDPALSVPMDENVFYRHEMINLFAAWSACFTITVFNAVVSVLALKIKNRDS